MNATGVVRMSSILALPLIILLSLASPPGVDAEPEGEVMIAWHVTLAPAWLDPATAPAQITPFAVLYALHDGLVRPLPGQRIGPSLAESFKESPDGLVYEFKIKKGVKFHNGDPGTAEGAKFSFERYKGAGAKALPSRVTRVQAPGSCRSSSRGSRSSTPPPCAST